VFHNKKNAPTRETGKADIPGEMSHAGKSLSKADQHLDQVKKVLLQVRKCPTKKLLEESLVGFIDKHKVNYKEVCILIKEYSKSTNPKVRLHMLFAISHLSRRSENKGKFAKRFESDLSQCFSSMVGTQVCRFGMQKEHLEKAARLCQTWRKEGTFTIVASDSFAETVSTSLSNERLPCECNHCSALTIDKVLDGYGKRDILQVDTGELELLDEYCRKMDEHRAPCSLNNTPASASTTPCSQQTPSSATGSASNTTEESRKIVSIYKECAYQALADFPLDRQPILLDIAEKKKTPEEEAEEKEKEKVGAGKECGGFDASRTSGVEVCARCTYPFPSLLPAEQLAALGGGITDFLRSYAKWMGRHDVEGIRLCGDGLQFKSEKRGDGQRVYYYSTDVRLRITNEHQYSTIASLCKKRNISVLLEGKPGSTSFKIEFDEARVVVNPENGETNSSPERRRKSKHKSRSPGRRRISSHSSRHDGHDERRKSHSSSYKSHGRDHGASRHKHGSSGHRSSGHRSSGPHSSGHRSSDNGNGHRHSKSSSSRFGVSKPIGKFRPEYNHRR
jgi:hypothetical protein